MKYFFAAILAALSISSALADTVTPPARAASAVGTGYYVSGSKVYDPSGKEFRIRGTNITHYDSNHVGVSLFKGSVTREGFNFTKPESYNWGLVTNDIQAHGLVAMPGNWTGTCQSDPAYLTRIVDTWVAQAATWTQLNNTGFINIANEWGPGDSIVWRDSYITAIQRMRAAGYTGALVVDSGSCGQDSKDIIKYGAAVLASDPEKNIIFDVHVYGSFHYPAATAAWQQDYTVATEGLFASGLPFIFGEFGPGNSVGPSPTTLPPGVLVDNAEAHGVGWLSWSYDDNNLPNCGSNDAWFSWVYNSCQTYTGADAQLTSYGKVMRDLLIKYTYVAPPVVPVTPVLTTALPLHCRPSYSCSIQLAATSPIDSKITYSLSGQPTGVSMGSTGLFAWWTSPVIGSYDMTLTLKDAAGNTSVIPLTLNVSW